MDPESSGSPPMDVPSEGESPEEYALCRELGRATEEGLQSLAPDRRLAVTLVDVQGFSYEESADIMNCSLGTVKSRVARGRAEMRDLLQRDRELLPGKFRQDI